MTDGSRAWLALQCIPILPPLITTPSNLVTCAQDIYLHLSNNSIAKYYEKQKDGGSSAARDAPLAWENMRMLAWALPLTWTLPTCKGAHPPGHASSLHASIS